MAIGRALLAQPRILLMDEPLASLDAPRKAEILDYIERLRDELRIPIVYVSHSVEEIARLADTVVVLSEGKCLAVGDGRRRCMGRPDLRPQPVATRPASLIEARVARARSCATTSRRSPSTAASSLVPNARRAAVGERVRARIRARDVSLALRRPEQVSILNVLPGHGGRDSRGTAP